MGQPPSGVAGARGPRFTLFARQIAEERRRIESVLETTRLTEQRHRRAGDLSHGQKQWLEIGMLLAQEPQLLLVDEPVAGMTDSETEQTAMLLREINRNRSVVVVVEHDMGFVRALGVKVTVLHEQQLAIARALVMKLRLLVLDEPTEGIQPSIIKDIGRVITLLRQRGEMAIVLVEQYYDFARELAQSMAIMDRGDIVLSGPAGTLDEDDVRIRLSV